MKHILATSVFAFLFSLQVFGQTSTKSSVTLTGSVISVEPYCVSQANGNEDCTFVLDLYLQFRNETDSPIIIFKTAGFYGQKRIEFLERIASARDSGGSSEEISWKSPYTGYDYDPFPSFVRELSGMEPSKNSFVTIAAGSYYETRERIRLRSGYQLRTSAGRRPSDPPVQSANPEFRALRIEYYLSLNDRLETAASLRMAQSKWNKFGQLILNSDGDYSVKSEIILNRLPE